MQKRPVRMAQSPRQRKLRMRSGSGFFCLICYAVAFAIPLLWQYAAIRLIYPWKLASTAPDLAAHLLDAFPFVDQLAAIAARTSEGVSPLREVLAAREQVWLAALAVCALCAWLLTLLVQLLWRFTHRSPILAARQTARAIHSYRLTILIIWAINLAAAAGLWLFGVQFIPGRTIWDYLVSFGIYLLLPLSAAFVSRFAASASISGKHGFFKRL